MKATPKGGRYENESIAIAVPDRRIGTGAYGWSGRHRWCVANQIKSRPSEHHERATERATTCWWAAEVGAYYIGAYYPPPPPSPTWLSQPARAIKSICFRQAFGSLPRRGAARRVQHPAPCRARWLQPTCHSLLPLLSLRNPSSPPPSLPLTTQPPPPLPLQFWLHAPG
jgi:hypothetical protein